MNRSPASARVAQCDEDKGLKHDLGQLANFPLASACTNIRTVSTSTCEVKLRWLEVSVLTDLKKPARSPKNFNWT